MISVSKARQLINETTSKGSLSSIDLYHALGHALAVDVIAPMDFPSFHQSAMDGYAFRFDDWQIEKKLFVEQEIQAGQIHPIRPLKHGEAVRIFTGAKVPDEADTVVMQEHTIRTGNDIVITNTELKYGSNIRIIGSQTKKGDCILKEGHRVNPASAALIAGLGMSLIHVYKRPSIILLTTGKELIHPGTPLQNGQIYESNSYALVHGLKQMHLEITKKINVDDDKEKISIAIQEALKKADILLITGGVSVGDYDFVALALAKNQVETIFHRVKQKPGKPLLFGVKNSISTEPQKIVFGLPGNPGSVLTCFYEYVVPCLRKIMGYTQIDLTAIRLPLLDDIHKKAGLTHFIKGKIKNNGVEVLEHQESYKMNGFANADCFIVVPEETESLLKGEWVDVHLINL